MTRSNGILIRLEPAAITGFVAHAFYVWTGAELGLGRWPVGVGLAVAGSLAVYGLVRPGGTAALARSGIALAALVAIGESTGGLASSIWTVWLATFAIFLSISLESPGAFLSPPSIAGVYLVGAYFGVANLGLMDAAMRSTAFLAGGIAAYLLGHVVLGLRDERDRVTDRLKEAESVIDAAFATSLGGMAVLDLTGRVVAANLALAQMLGRGDGAVEGADWPILLHPAETGEMRERLAALVAGDRASFETDARLLRADGSVIHAVVGISAVVDTHGVPVHLFAHVTNISDRVRSERLLHQSESHYRHLFELSPVPLWEIDVTAVVAQSEQWIESGESDLEDHFTDHPEDLDALIGATRVRTANEAARTLFQAADDTAFATGLMAGELGRDHAAAYADLIVAMSRGILQGERPVQIEDFVGGEHVGVLRTLVPRVDGEPDLTGVVVAFVDATEQAEAELTLVRLEEQLHTVMSGAPIIMFALDADGVYTLSEGQALTLIDQTSGSVVGRSVFEVHRDSSALLYNMRRALGGETFTGVDEVGDLLFETRYSPVFAGDEVTGVVGVSSDITDRVRTADRLRELIRSKDDFVATVSHELRTPLTAVVGFAHELRDGLAQLTTEEIDTYAGLIERQATEVADLVEDLLVATRADQGEVPISLGATDLWEQVTAVLDARPLSKSVDIEGRDVDAKAFADAIRVRQVVRNLLVNADRYGGASIQVRVTDGDGVKVVSVSDDGAGIPEAHRAFIFEPYHRAHREDGRTESVGLGLTVSRQLAELMGGTLEYSYRDGKSVFDLVLPAA